MYCIHGYMDIYAVFDGLHDLLLYELCFFVASSASMEVECWCAVLLISILHFVWCGLSPVSSLSKNNR